MLPVVAAAVAALLFAQAAVRLRRRGRPDLAGWDRAALFGLGLALTLVALVSPLDRIAEDSLLSAHMAQHVLLGDAAAALLVVAVRGPLLVFSLHPLYPAYTGAYGISALTDQKVSGVVMMAEQLLTLGVLTAVLLRPRLRSARLAAA